MESVEKMKLIETKLLRKSQKGTSSITREDIYLHCFQHVAFVGMKQSVFITIKVLSLSLRKKWIFF
jgi:hypothetical protein